MKKICIVQGVGFFKDNPAKDMKEFMKKLSGKTGAECFVHRWQHDGKPPKDPRNSLFFKPFREWVHEVMMDYAQVVVKLEGLQEDLPEADMYIGHSAGGVIVADGTDKPRIICGCPVQLIRNLVKPNTEADILNLMHYRDPIAAPIIGARNEITKDPAIWSLVNPIAAHTSYWTGEDAMKHIVKYYKARVEGV